MQCWINNSLILILSIVFLFATSIVIILMFKLKKTQQELRIANRSFREKQMELESQARILKEIENAAGTHKNALEETNKHLASQTMILSHFSSFLSEVRSQLYELNYTTEKTENKEQLKKIISSIGYQINSKSWNEFQQQYLNSSEEFLTKLIQAHPNLTSGERRLCVMLRMNLSIKEISELTMQSARAIEMARHRLRTKFGIEREENLLGYLAKFN